MQEAKCEFRKGTVAVCLRVKARSESVFTDNVNKQQKRWASKQGHGMLLLNGVVSSPASASSLGEILFPEHILCRRLG